MPYTAWSVIFGEQPSAAKWNQLGENDAGFKDGTNIDEGVILPAHLGDRLLASEQLGSQVQVTSTTPVDLLTANITVSKDGARISILAHHVIQKITAAGWGSLLLYIDDVLQDFVIVDGVVSDWNILSLHHVTTLDAGAHTVKTKGKSENSATNYVFQVSSGSETALASRLSVFEG